MTPSDTKEFSTPFGNLRFESATSLWFQQNMMYHMEVAIGGGANGPSEDSIQFTAQLLPHIEQLVPTARQYLDLFVKTNEFKSEDEWFLEGVLLNAPPAAAADQFGLCFTPFSWGRRCRKTTVQ